jgi:ankyrin repeat protein
MKVLLICLEEEKEKTSKLAAFLEKTGISPETLLIKSRDEGRKIIENATHVAVLSELGPGWIDFLAGFFCGSHISILVCGEKAIESIPNVYAFCFKFLKTETELNNYFVSEYEAIKKNDAAGEINHARQALLDRGIPPTIDVLAQCVAEDKVEEVSLFLAAGFSPDTKNKNGIPLLNVSARNGHLKTLELLLCSGAHVNLIADDRGSTALFDSAMGRHKSLVKALIEAGADVNIPSKGGQTALVVVVGAGDEEIVELLVKAGADPDVEDSLGVSARKYAALFRKTTMINLFDTYASGKAT